MAKPNQTQTQSLLDLNQFQDEWAAVKAAELELQYQRQTAEQRQKDIAAERKHQLRNDIWGGVGVIIVCLIVAALIFGAGFAAWRSSQNNRNKGIELEKERTKQVAACAALEQPVERQYCLLAISGNQPKEDS